MQAKTCVSKIVDTEFIKGFRYSTKYVNFWGWYPNSLTLAYEGLN